MRLAPTCLAFALALVMAPTAVSDSYKVGLSETGYAPFSFAKASRGMSAGATYPAGRTGLGTSSLRSP